MVTSPQPDSLKPAKPMPSGKPVAPNLLLQEFESLADTPDAVPKLRAFILDLAIRGALVPQNPQDLPASKLVELAKAQMKEQRKPNRASHGDEPNPPPPFPPPQNWCWTRLDDLGHTASRNDLPDKTEVGFAPMRLITARFGDPISFESRQWAEVRKGFTHFADGDVVVAKITPCFENGKSGVIRGTPNGSGAGTTELHVFRPIPNCVIPEYVLVFLKSPHFLVNGEEHMTGSAGQKRVPWEYFARTSFPLPPLPEQRRIVVKVEELLALCDELETRQTTAREHRTRLVHSALDHLTAAKDEQGFQKQCSFILHDSSLILDSVPALRQAILSLALRGKLVPHDPNDEEVEHLLARNDERRRETARRDHRADIENQPLLSADDRWEVADTWSWRALADLVLFVDYRGRTPVKLSSGVRLLTAKNVRKGQVNLSPEEFLSEEDYHDWMTRGFPRAGDVLFTTEAPMGNAAVVELTEKFALAQRVICFQSYGAIDPVFLVMQILSNQFQLILDKNGTGVTAKGIKASKLKRLPVAIPPFAEQQRIIAKVDELMRWCDALEARLAAAQTTVTHLLDATLDRALKGEL
jgi:type I restriction enzyme, S subunit